MQNGMKQQNEINWLVAGKILSGEANIEEKQSFNNWLSDEQNRLEWDLLSKHIEKVDYSLISENVNIDKAWKIVNQRTKTSIKKNILFSVFAAASILLAFWAISLILEKSDLNTITTAKKSNTIELSDGSFIELNRFSSLNYPKTFTKQERKVNMEGEAFFNIKKNKEKPFVIHTNKLEIIVLGTSFNVKAYPQKQIQEVTVKTGIVKVSSISKPQMKITLHPGDKAIYSNSDTSILKQKIQNENYIAWKTKNFNFKNEKLSDVLNLIEEVYYININIPKNTDLDILYTANFENTSVKKIIQTINSTFSINLTFDIKN